MSLRKDWDICPHYKTNFEVYLVNSGRWDRGMFQKTDPEWGKWLCFFKPKGENLVPTLGDQRNFLTGLFEAEWLNDNFILLSGKTRPPQRQNKIDMFKRILDTISNRADVKDTEKGLDYYLEGGQDGA